MSFEGENEMSANLAKLDTTVPSESEETKQDIMVELKFNELEMIEKKLHSFLVYRPIRKCLDLKTVDLYIHEILEILKKNGQKCLHINEAEENHSDLVPSVYEGGAKIWECTYDLINYIENWKMDFRDKKVLDLGCGTGLVGIMCLSRRATCYFQDYNDEVLKYITFPNVKANVEYFPENNFESCKFFSGDWSIFLNYWLENYPDQKFDYIFTSETIYNPVNYHKLHSIFEELLSPQGKIYLASKSYYFGCGGGTYAFKDFLKENKKFECDSVWKFVNGLVREIFEIKFK